MKYWLIITGFLIPALVAAESKRIEVYPETQAFWDVQPGDTLSGIVIQLTPRAPRLRQQLMADIIKLNPDAFINHNPDQLKAHIRLWLPNATQVLRHTRQNERYIIKDFNWGYIQIPR